LDTKWRSRIGVIAWLVLFAYGVSGVLSALVNDRDYLQQNYFETSQFQGTIGEFSDYLNMFEVSYQTKEEMIKKISITQEEIDEHRYRYGNLTDQITNIEQRYNHKIEEAEANNNTKAADAYKKERDEKIADITKNFESDEHVKAKIVKEKEKHIDKYLKQLEAYRDDYESYEEAFAYFLRDTETGEIYTNLSTKDSNLVDEFINDKTMHFIQTYPTKDHTYLSLINRPLFWQYDEDIDFSLNGHLFEGQIAVSKNTPATNRIMLDYHSYQSERISFWIYTLGALVALVVSMFIGKKFGLTAKIAPAKWQTTYNKIPFDLAILLLFISILTALGITSESSPHVYYNPDDIVFFLFWLTIVYGLTWLQCKYMYNRVKMYPFDRKVWENTLLYKVLNMFRNAFLNRKLGTQVFFILIIFFANGLFLGLAGLEEGFLIIFFPLFFLIGIPLFFISIKKLGDFNKIMLHTRAIADGRYEPDLPVKGKSVFAKHAEDINKMKHGVKQSQTAQAKSERLKTELITNVSHDLRTPLTSIITYSELLKNPELTEDERGAYLEIIDRKSKRLKVLIDDLFEASKMASGSIELLKEKVDIVQLLQQSLAEYNESMQESGIQFRVTNPEKPVYALVDGQKLWRVFENLIGNMLKYSLPNTRAFINVKEEHNQIVITFKNISKYELSENSDELFERFKRGDESRHTEGSGLGLAIAKSIIDLHEGALDIEVDGDLFKVTIRLATLSQVR